MDKPDDQTAQFRADPIGTLDLCLSAVSPRGEYPFYRAGYMLWPNPRQAESAAIRLLSMGNSTSLWPDSDWSRRLGQMLRDEGHDIGLFHGAGKGNTSSQELMRVIRDAPAIGAGAIISLSGICDIGHLLNSRNYPFAHKYMRRILDFARKTGLANEVTYGYPDPVSPAQSWCRNQRLARAAAQELGIPILVFLQPVQGYGAYPMTAAEQAFFDQKAAVTLRAIDKPYGQCVTEFYDEVRQIIADAPQDFIHVIDFTDVFDDCPGAYRDHRHQTPQGIAHLAARMLPHVKQLIGLPG